MSTQSSRGAKASPAATITAAILARLDRGVKPWVRPWRRLGCSRPLRACGTPYRGINVFWLWLVADAQGFASSFWMTYRQAQALGGQVRKGETASVAVFYKSYAAAADRKQPSDGDDEASPALRRVLKSYAVFNADQIDGLSGRYLAATAGDDVEPAGREADLDAFFAAVPAQVRTHGDQAYYEPDRDRVTMPAATLFTGFDHYYATLAHELAHWTGHPCRLGRDLPHRFGSAAYAAEELIAELAAAMLGSDLGLPVAHLDHHASYIDHWRRLLEADERAILTAAARAEEAAALLLRLGGREGVDRAIEPVDSQQRKTATDAR